MGGVPLGRPGAGARHCDARPAALAVGPTGAEPPHVPASESSAVPELRLHHRGSPLSTDVEGPSRAILRLPGSFLKAFLIRLCCPEHPSARPKPAAGGPVLPQGAPRHWHNPLDVTLDRNL